MLSESQKVKENIQYSIMFYYRKYDLIYRGKKGSKKLPLAQGKNS